MQVNKYNTLKNRNQVYHNYKYRNKVILTNRAAYKYKTPYKGPFVITLCFTNGTVNIKYGPIQIRNNIRRIKPYKFDTKVEDINPQNMCDDVNI